MPSGIHVDVLIASADDVVAPVDPADDGKALVRNSATGKYEHVVLSGGGGGTSDHAALTNLAYAAAAHTGFAGTGATNTFTREQTLQSSIEDAALSGEFLDNAGFDDDLSFWTDIYDAGWAWDTGAAILAPAVAGDLVQSGVGVTSGEVHVLEAQVSAMTAGYVEIRIVDGDSTIPVVLEFTSDDTRRGVCILVGPTIDVVVAADEFFDGRIEYVSLVKSNTGFPTNIRFRDYAGNYAGDIKTAAGRLIIGNTNSPSSQIVELHTGVLKVIGGVVGESWRSLTYYNDGDTIWADYGGADQVGQFKKFGDMVYVRGLVYRSSGAGNTVATLPGDCLPPANLVFTQHGDDVAARVDVDTSGNIVSVSGVGTTYLALNFSFSVAT